VACGFPADFTVPTRRPPWCDEARMAMRACIKLDNLAAGTCRGNTAPPASSCGLYIFGGLALSS